MWDRAQLKDTAKYVLRKYYWVAFLVSFVGGLISRIPNTLLQFNNSYMRSITSNYRMYGYGENIDTTAMLSMLTVLLGVSAILLVITVIWDIFLGGPLETGIGRYFLEAREDRSDFSNLFYSFKKSRYVNNVKAMGWRYLFIFLWSLLFLIPGIVKSYAYCMVPYIMVDNPDMDYRRALQLSMAMTFGEKGDIFFLDLSFFGWYLLGMLACCIGSVFVNPYFYATRAELYVALRQKAIERNLCTAEELNQPLPDASV